MRKFIINISLFFLPFILLAYPLDKFLSNNLRKSNLIAVKEYPVWNAIFDSKVNSDIVIYGSSRAWVHIDAPMIQDSLKIRTYNLGIDGHNFWLQNLRHRLLLKFNKKPELIIYSVDIFTLQKRGDLYNKEQFLPYMLWDKDIERSTISYNGFNIPDYYVPLLRYYGKYDHIREAFRLKLKPQNNAPTRKNGYEGQLATWNDDFDKAKVGIEKYTANLDTASVRLFEAFLKNAISQKIKVALIYTPEYIEGQEFTKNRNEIINIYKSLGIKYDIPFYDFSNDSMVYDKKYFYNAEHLNKSGAELLTKELIDTLKKYNYFEMNKAF